MKRTIKIGDKDVQMETSAQLPKMYRDAYGRELFKDIMSLQGITEEAMYDCEIMELLERVSYTMAKHADDKIKGMDEWLKQFEMFDLLTAMPDIMELWTQETSTSSISKKNSSQQ